jgi:hypothetical protein
MLTVVTPRSRARFAHGSAPRSVRAISAATSVAKSPRAPKGRVCSRSAVPLHTSVQVAHGAPGKSNALTMAETAQDARRSQCRSTVTSIVTVKPTPRPFAAEIVIACAIPLLPRTIIREWTPTCWQWCRRARSTLMSRVRILRVGEGESRDRRVSHRIPVPNHMCSLLKIGRAIRASKDGPVRRDRVQWTAESCAPACNCARGSVANAETTRFGFRACDPHSLCPH